MKKVLFIHSHFDSGYSQLIQQLENTVKIQCFNGYTPLKHPQDLMVLTNNKHKLKNAAAIYMHPVIENHEWVSSLIRDNAKNIFLIAHPKYCFYDISHKFVKGLDYYAFRLRGLYEVAKRTDNKVFATIDDISPINKYLGLEIPPMKIDESQPPQEWTDKYNYYLKLFTEFNRMLA